MVEAGEIRVRVHAYGNQGPVGQDKLWENLIVWMKRYHDKEVRMRFGPPTQIPTGCTLDQAVIGGMFMIVDGMEEEDWSEIEKVLIEQRNILTRIDARWGDDGTRV